MAERGQSIGNNNCEYENKKTSLMNKDDKKFWQYYIKQVY
jgi:hypothetical protein